MHVYRLVRRDFALHYPFSGEGFFLYGGRWSSPGARLSYASIYRSLAVLEYRAHIDPAFANQDLVIAALLIPEDVPIPPTPPLPENWRNIPAPKTLRAVGDEFVSSSEAAIMLIPSVILPDENNVLINPSHPDTLQLARLPLVDFRFDPAPVLACDRVVQRSTRDGQPQAQPLRYGTPQSATQPVP